MSISKQLEESRIAIDNSDKIDSVFTSDTTKNATKFHSWEAPTGFREGGRRESYEDWYHRLWGYHTGLYNGWWENASKLNQLSKWYLLDMVSSDLELTPHQQAEAEHLLETKVTDMRRYNSRHPNEPPTETVIVALCAYVAHQDGRQCHPNHDEHDELFENIRADIGIRQSFYLKTYGRLEQTLLRS